MDKDTINILIDKRTSGLKNFIAFWVIFSILIYIVIVWHFVANPNIPKAITLDSVEAHEFILVDQNGRTRGEFSFDKGIVPWLVLYDENGDNKIVITDRPMIRIRNPEDNVIDLFILWNENGQMEKLDLFELMKTIETD